MIHVSLVRDSLIAVMCFRIRQVVQSPVKTWQVSQTGRQRKVQRFYGRAWKCRVVKARKLWSAEICRSFFAGWTCPSSRTASAHRRQAVRANPPHTLCPATAIAVTTRSKTSTATSRLANAMTSLRTPKPRGCAAVLVTPRRLPSLEEWADKADD